MAKGDEAMSVYIKVDHGKFERVAGVIDDYVKNHRANMNQANTEVNALSKAWQGQDFNQFQSQWNRVFDKDSTSQKMVNAMENYAKFLRFAANKYKEAQSNAINRANGIPRW